MRINKNPVQINLLYDLSGKKLWGSKKVDAYLELHLFPSFPWTFVGVLQKELQVNYTRINSLPGLFINSNNIKIISKIIPG